MSQIPFASAARRFLFASAARRFLFASAASPLFLSLSLSLFLFSCSPSTAPDDPRVFRYNESTGLLSLDPAQARSLEPIWVVDQIYDALTALDNQLRVQPCVASRWDVDSTGTVYTFYVRSGVEFPPTPEVPGLEEGRAVVAADVIYSLERLRDPAVASAGAWILEPLASEGGMVALDDSTLRFQLREPFPAFPGLLGTAYASIVPREAVNFYGADFRRNPVGTGPFELAWWEEDIALVLHRNDSYWEKDEAGEQLPYIEAVHIDFVRDASAEAAGLQSGKYDFVSGLHAAYMEDFLDEKGSLREQHKGTFRMERTPYLKTDYIGMNVDPFLPANSDSPFLDARVRRALSLVIDREGIATHLKRGTVVPSDHFTPPALVGQAEPLEPESSLEQAQRLMAEAGYPGGAGWPEGLSLLTTAENADLCAALQHDWSQLGVEIGVEVVPPGVHRERVSKGEAAIFRKTWLGDYPDAENFLALFVSANAAPAGPNYTRFHSESFDRLYATAISEPDVARREQKYRELDSLIHREMSLIPLYHDEVIHFVRNDISGWFINGVNRLDLRRVKKAPKMNSQNPQIN